jgi:hypothetical protein
MSRPTAAPAYFPYAHRTIAEVDRDQFRTDEHEGLLSNANTRAGSKMLADALWRELRKDAG